MGNTSSTETGFKSMPREIRDEIYSHLLTSTYQVNASPAFRLSNLSDDTQMGAFTGPGFGQEVTLSPLFTFEKPSDRLAILRVNRSIGAEAREVLYRLSTFLFTIGSLTSSPAIDFSNIKALKDMQNIEINIDYDAVYSIRERLSDLDAALISAHRLFLCIARSSDNRNQCIITFKYHAKQGLNANVYELIGPSHLFSAFGTVEWRFHKLSVHNRKPTLFGPFVSEDERLQTYKWFDQSLRLELGPGVIGYDTDSVYHMTYYPKRHSRATQLFVNRFGFSS